MEFKYNLDVRVSIEVDGREVYDSYEESGETSICDDVEENLDMFVKPRIEAAGYVLTKRLKDKV